MKPLNLVKPIDDRKHVEELGLATSDCAPVESFEDREG
jgi:hypothetical protein